MAIDPVGFRMEWKPGDPCYLSAADYARESQRDGADTWGLFTDPQPGCSAEIEVYRGWCWVRPRYVSAVRDLAGFTPLYLGPLIHRGLLSEAAAYLFPRLIEDQLRKARPDLYPDGVPPTSNDQQEKRDA